MKPMRLTSLETEAVRMAPVDAQFVNVLNINAPLYYKLQSNILYVTEGGAQPWRVSVYDVYHDLDVNVQSEWPWINLRFTDSII